ncbi:MAG: hypothetical protein WBJ62_03105 [Coriobacteriia bacterium]
MARKTTWSRSSKLRFAATTMVAAITLTIVAAVVPNVVTAQAAATSPVFRSQLAESTAASKLAASTEQPLAANLTARARTATTIQPVVATRTTTRRVTTSTGTTAAAPAPSGDELAQAQSILAGYIAKYPILAGSSVTIGDASGYQAVAYYKSGRIVISATHTASLSRIIGHEIWHIIDWRDNGVIDWGENVPPN